jgi:uncharacterized protein (TIGR02996 family)
VVRAGSRVPRDPTEATLLAAIASCEAGSRGVYADWLDDRDDSREAAFVRSQEVLADLHDQGDRARYLTEYEIARGPAGIIDADYRRVLGRPAIEGCRAADGVPCPKDWGNLARGTTTDVRTCTACNRNVHFVRSVGDAIIDIRRRITVVVDVVEARRFGDLDG